MSAGGRSAGGGAGPSSPAPAQGRVLIVDDEVFIRNAFQLYLETQGFAVQVAESGERALEIVSDSAVPLDVVILDLVMPGVQGLEVLKAVKARRPSVEVIIVTGCGSMGSAIEALRYGAFDYITKPIVNFDEGLLKVVLEALKSRQAGLKLPPPQPAVKEQKGDRERLALLERVVEMAALGNRSRQNEPQLERVEESLKKHFGVKAGVVLHRHAGDFQPVYSWGFSGPLCPGEERPSQSEVVSAIRDGLLAFFPASALDAARWGVLPEDVAPWRKMACLPLVLSGSHWGSLLLFFGEESQAPLSGPIERHPFQALCPVLASLLSGSLRQARSL